MQIKAVTDMSQLFLSAEPEHTVIKINILKIHTMPCLFMISNVNYSKIYVYPATGTGSDISIIS